MAETVSRARGRAEERGAPTDMSIEKRAGAVDRMAAVLILQSFLAARANG